MVRGQKAGEELNFPNKSVEEHDLDADGDLVLSAPVERMQAVVFACRSIDGNTWSASVSWNGGGTGDPQPQSPSDLQDTTSAWQRLVRKGSEIEVTITSEEAAGTTNRVSAYLDSHR